MVFYPTTNFSTLPSPEHSPWLPWWVTPSPCARLEDAGNDVSLTETSKGEMQSNLHTYVYIYLYDLLAN